MNCDTFYSTVVPNKTDGNGFFLFLWTIGLVDLVQDLNGTRNTPREYTPTSNTDNGPTGINTIGKE